VIAAAVQQLDDVGRQTRFVIGNRLRVKIERKRQILDAIEIGCPARHDAVDGAPHLSGF